MIPPTDTYRRGSRITNDSFPKRATAHGYMNVHLLDAVCKFSCLLAGHRQTSGIYESHRDERPLPHNRKSVPVRDPADANKARCVPLYPALQLFHRSAASHAQRRKPPGFRNVGINIECERISINNFNNVKDQRLSFSLSFLLSFLLVQTRH